jgi:chromosome segregation ATPase
MTTVVLAEQQLNAARVAEASAKREAAQREIKRLRSEGAALLKQFRPMVRQIRAAEQERLKLHGQLVNARAKIAFYSLPLDPATLLSDEEIAEHAAQLTAWKVKQQELLAQHADAVKRESIRAAAVAIKSRLEYLQYSLRNLSAVAEGRLPGELEEGGIFEGVEDFVTVPSSGGGGVWGRLY